jgi:hypothetical protein
MQSYTQMFFLTLRDEKTTKIMNFEKERLDVIKVEHN